MEIATVNAIPLSFSYGQGRSIGGSRGRTDTRATTLVSLETTCGAIGWGEAFAPPRAVAALIEDIFADEIKGLDPSAIESLAEWVYTGEIGGYHIGRGPLMQSALAGVETAMWDLRGQKRGKPIHELLSGDNNKHIIPYASTMYFCDSEEDPVESIRDAVEEGYDAVKIKIGKNIKSDLERVEAARDALPNDGHLMVDYNGNYTAKQAIQSIKQISTYDITWVEEPVPPENYSGYREIKTRTDVPLAAGEAHASRFEFKELIDNNLVDIIQPNVSKCGGLSEAMLLAKMATTENILVRPHVWNSAIGTIASLHFAVSLPSYPYHYGKSPEPILFECDRSDNPLRTDILKQPLQLTGDLSAPKNPGLGVSVDVDAIDQYRIKQRQKDD